MRVASHEMTGASTINLDHNPAGALFGEIPEPRFCFSVCGSSSLEFPTKSSILMTDKKPVIGLYGVRFVSIARARLAER